LGILYTLPNAFQNSSAQQQIYSLTKDKHSHINHQN